MPLFFLAPGAIRGDVVTLTGALARHIGGSLRHRVGDCLTVADEHGARFRVEVTDVASASIRAVVRRRLGSPPPQAVRLTLAQAVLKGSNMDTVLQKAAELGAQRLVPLITRRTVVRPRREREDRQLARWRAIVLEAAQQSEQARIPDVEEPRTLEAFLAEPSTAGEVRLMLWEDERDRGLRDAVDAGPPPPRATLLVGPEGGFDPEEAHLARSAGFVTVSLGDAVLRAETAGPVALALLQYAWGDLGRRPRGDAD